MCSHGTDYERGRADRRNGGTRRMNLVRHGTCPQCGLNSQSSYDLGWDDEGATFPTELYEGATNMQSLPITVDATVNVSVVELDIAIERAMSAITRTDGRFVDLALRSTRLDDMATTYAERLAIPVTDNLRDCIALALLTGIVTERILSTNATITPED